LDVLIDISLFFWDVHKRTHTHKHTER